jgi:hypothetical protein
LPKGLRRGCPVKREEPLQLGHPAEPLQPVDSLDRYLGPVQAGPSQGGGYPPPEPVQAAAVEQRTTTRSEQKRF